MVDTFDCLDIDLVMVDILVLGHKVADLLVHKEQLDIVLVVDRRDLLER
jgi:hypothetical protein